MPDLVLELLKYLFLVVLYVFVARAVRAVYKELRSAPAPAIGRGAASTAGRSSSRRAKKSPVRAVVVEGASKSGKSFELGSELTIGRADKCHIIIDDTYVSQVHARIHPSNSTYVIEDLGSTNGTYVNRKRITSPVELQRGDKVKIGKTVLEMRR